MFITYNFKHLSKTYLQNALVTSEQLNECTQTEQSM